MTESLHVRLSDENHTYVKLKAKHEGESVNKTLNVIVTDSRIRAELQPTENKKQRQERHKVRDELLERLEAMKKHPAGKATRPDPSDWKHTAWKSEPEGRDDEEFPHVSEKMHIECKHPAYMRRPGRICGGCGEGL